MKYKHNKTDTNEKHIVKALRKILGKDNVQTGYDDILVGYKGLTYWYEIKNPEAIAKKTGRVFNRKCKTTIKQCELLDTWAGHYRIVSTLDEILDELGIRRA